MPRKFFINTEATDLSNPFVFSETLRDAVRLSALSIGDVLAGEFVFVDASGKTAWSGASGYTFEIAIGKLNGRPSGGTWTLTYEGQTTAALAHNATPAQVQAALEALSTIGTGNVTVSGVAGVAYRIVGAGALAGSDLAALTSDASALFPPSSAPVVTLREGAAGLAEIKAVRLVQLPATYTDVFTLGDDGFVAELPTNTTGIYDLLGDDDYVDLTLAIRVTGAAVGDRTFARVPVRIHSQVISEEALIQSPLSGGAITMDEAIDLFAQLDDPRFDDARTPLAHAASHAAAGADPIAPADIGAADAVHTHEIEDVTGLATALAGKAAAAHGHDAADITSGVLDIERIPQAALERVKVVADEAARFALTTAQVQEGDPVKQADTEQLYIVVDEDELDNASGYVEFSVGSAASVPWSGVTGKPADFTPSAHTHETSDVTGLDAALAAKADAADLSDLADIVDTKLDTPAIQITTEAGLTRTLSAADLNRYLRTTGATAVTIAIPLDLSEVSFPIGGELSVFQAGDGQVSFSPDAGVTLNSKDSNKKLSGKFSGAFLKRIATNVYDIVGDLTA